MTPEQILESAYRAALEHLENSFVDDPQVLARINLINRAKNRAGTRLLLACLLAKIHRPEIDIRKPYTEIGTDDAYSGRTYDERYIAMLYSQYGLPINPTTAFLTPALRNRTTPFSLEEQIAGTPREVYNAAIRLLFDIHEGQVSANNLLTEILRSLINLRSERQQRIASLLADLNIGVEIPLSAEAIVTLIHQHLESGNASRLPVLIVAAAYQCASQHLGERILPLEAHNSADKQTNAVGDLQITLFNDDSIVTVYEMKMIRVAADDILLALQKIAELPYRIDNYIFVTTEPIEQQVIDYARRQYMATGGIEVVVLDCISFLRHFLHLFHRLRMQFLDTYQAMVLAESESAVSQLLKEAFLNLRLASEAAGK